MSLITKALAGIAVTAAAVSLVRAVRRNQRPSIIVAELTPEIALDDDYDVTFWMRRFDVSKGQLTSAVRNVGTDPSRVQAYLDTH